MALTSIGHGVLDVGLGRRHFGHRDARRDATQYINSNLVEESHGERVASVFPAHDSLFSKMSTASD